MTPRTVAKFYKDVSILEKDGTYAVLLDGKPVTTPDRAPLALPSRAIAEAVAEEWQRPGGTIDSAKMPLTGLVNVAIDRVPKHREAVILHIQSYGRSDLLCYRAGAPEELSTRQAETWDPLLAWIEESVGAKLAVGHGIGFIVQPEQSLRALQEWVLSQGDFVLAAINLVASLTGSLVLALALVEGRIGADEAFAAATVDETFQAKNWGFDTEADARRAHLSAELAAVERFLRLLPA